MSFGVGTISTFRHPLVRISVYLLFNMIFARHERIGTISKELFHFGFKLLVN